MAACREQRGEGLTHGPVADDRDVGVENRSASPLLSGGERLAAGVLLDDGVLDRADPVDLDADAVAGLQPRPPVGIAAIPDGVPVAITSPGFKVQAWDRSSTWRKQSKMSCRVLDCCRSSPLT